MEWKKLVKELEWKDYSHGYREKKYVILGIGLIIPIHEWERTDLNEVRLVVDLPIRLDQIVATVRRDEIKVKGVDRN